MEQLKVLVVDDDDAMRVLLQLHLANAGYAVTLAEDALVAGRKLLEAAPDLIILDVNLPYMSGLELAAILIADATIPHVPIIFISAHEGYAAQAEALGADFIVKPFLKPRLLESVARYIRPRAPVCRVSTTALKDPTTAMQGRRGRDLIRPVRTYGT
jgi:CheY-like chemotaxis protein